MLFRKADTDLVGVRRPLKPSYESNGYQPSPPSPQTWGGPRHRKPRELHLNIIRFFIILIIPAAFAGCFCWSDFISWTPLWWTNERVVQPRGVLDTVSVAAQTHNYMDNGKLYRYSVENGVIRCSIDNGPWNDLFNGNPKDSLGNALMVKNIAADNNRIFVLASDSIGRRSLWWYCVKGDQAIWSQMLISAGGDLMKQGYREWTDRVHKTGVWTNLLQLREFEKSIKPRMVRRERDSTWTDSAGITRTVKIPYLALEAQFVPRSGIDLNDIVDIAVGNWSETVVTYYVLLGSTGTIKYIDEEVVMDRWQTVPHLCNPCKSSPYPLDSTTRIEASNSIICAWSQTAGGGHVRWIRWDFHNKQDFKYWPLDWCEHEWQTTPVCPASSVSSMRIDTHWPIGDVRDTMWTTPRTAWDWNWKGFLGHLKPNLVSAYPVNITITGAEGVYTFYRERQGDVAGWVKE